MTFVCLFFAVSIPFAVMAGLRREYVAVLFQISTVAVGCFLGFVLLKVISRFA